MIHSGFRDEAKTAHQMAVSFVIQINQNLNIHMREIK